MTFLDIFKIYCQSQSMNIILWFDEWTVQCMKKLLLTVVRFKQSKELSPMSNKKQLFHIINTLNLGDEGKKKRWYIV